jgi:uncharacterized C2H2 Zn-finger protein
LEEDGWTSIRVDGIRIYKCRSCTFMTRLLGDVKRHFNEKHSSDPILYDCPRCPYRAKRKGSLKTHIICVHALDTGGEIFDCPHCPFKAGLRPRLIAHVNKHHPGIQNSLQY